MYNTNNIVCILKDVTDKNSYKRKQYRMHMLKLYLIIVCIQINQTNYFKKQEKKKEIN